MAGYSEDELIEQPAIALFGELKWEAADCFHEFEQAGGSPLGRETAAEVVLVRRLRAALEKLNPKAPAEAITQAIEEFTRDRSRMSPAAANEEVYRLLKDGVKVRAAEEQGRRGARGKVGAGEQRSRGEREKKDLTKREARGLGLLTGIRRRTTASSWRRNSGSRVSCTRGGPIWLGS